jgi:FAD/FMN-containing dehydrogenase
MEATVLIPAYNEEATVASVVRVAREAGFPVVVAYRAGAGLVELLRFSAP